MLRSQVLGVSLFAIHIVSHLCKFIRYRTQCQFEGLVFLTFDQESCLKRVKPEENNFLCKNP